MQEQPRSEETNAQPPSEEQPDTPD
jgi:hypothetical protein